MTRVLVGIDGSRASGAALRWACRFAESTGEEVVATHAFRPPYSEIPPDDYAAARDRSADVLAGEWLRPAVDLGVHVKPILGEGDPRTALMETADEVDADLVVLGRTGAGGGPGLLHLGSVVEYAAHHTERPLAVIPRDADGEIHRIVVGVDGSAPSLAAVEWTASVAGALGADVVAVRVEEPAAEWTPAWDEHNWRRDAEHDLAAWTAPLEKAGVDVELIAAEYLHPAAGILGVAERQGADLVVLGTRGAGGFLGLRFGGVAMKVLHRAHLPLVLVPPTEER